MCVFQRKFPQISKQFSPELLSCPCVHLHIPSLSHCHLHTSLTLLAPPSFALNSSLLLPTTRNDRGSSDQEHPGQGWIRSTWPRQEESPISGACGLQGEQLSPLPAPGLQTGHQMPQLPQLNRFPQPLARQVSGCSTTSGGDFPQGRQEEGIVSSLSLILPPCADFLVIS